MGRVRTRGWLIGALIAAAVVVVSASALVFQGRDEDSTGPARPSATSPVRRTVASSTSTTSTTSTTTTTTTAAPSPPPPTEAPAPVAPAGYTYALRDDFLSPAEASFFHVLRVAVAEEYLIFPKVRLADLVFPPRQEGQHGAWQRINRKHIDFVLCAPRTLRPLVALELDDRSHRRPDRLERDAFVDRVFADAGLPLVHVPARRSYDTRTRTVTDLAVRAG